MGRSVSVPRNAVWTVYLDGSCECEPGDYCDCFEYLLDDIRQSIKGRYPSFEDSDCWLGREDHGVLENRHGHITVSEYCGLVALCFVPREEHYNDNAGSYALRQHFGEQIEAGVRKLYPGHLRKLGTFSNGESIYQRASA